MEVQFSPDVQAMLDQLVTETGRSKDEFVQDAMAGYLEELSRIRVTLDSRYDAIKAGKVELLSEEKVLARLHEKSIARRSQTQ